MPAPTVVGVSTANANGAGAITPAFPSGYTAVALDVAVTFIESESADTVTPPSGWATITSSTLSTGVTSKLSAISRRIVGGDTAPSIADAGDHMVGRMIILRGCATSGNPWDGFLSNTETVSDTTVSIPILATTVPECLVLAAFGTGQDVASTAGATGWADADLTGLTEQMDNWAVAGTGGGFAVVSGAKATAGAVANVTATLSLAANFKTLLAIAFRPPPADLFFLRRQAYVPYQHLVAQ